MLRDIRRHKAEKGDILATYTASAFFIEGWLKKNVIDLIHQDKIEKAVSVCVKIVQMIQDDADRVCKEIYDDLAAGMSIDEVEKKEYNMIIQCHCWMKPDEFPVEDPHWSKIELLNGTITGLDELNEVIQEN